MIPLKETSYDFEAISSQVIGAGIIPVSIDDENTVRLLLGKERYISHWRGSLKWSGFEGGRKAGETIEQTAAREFMEESMGVVQLEDAAPTVDRVTNFLLADKYIARIVLCIVHGERQERRYHVTYLVQVAYRSEYQTIFLDRRRLFLELQQKTLQISRLKETAMELGFPCENEAHEGLQVREIVSVQTLETGALRIRFLDDKLTPHVTTKRVGNDLTEMYMRLHKLKHMYENDTAVLMSNCADAVTIDTDQQNNVQSAKINEDFIEKQTIQWWKVSELKCVMKNGGYLNSEFFRAYFLPVLQRSIQEIESITTSTAFNCDV